MSLNHVMVLTHVMVLADEFRRWSELSDTCIEFPGEQDNPHILTSEFWPVTFAGVILRNRSFLCYGWNFVLTNRVI